MTEHPVPIGKLTVYFVKGVNFHLVIVFFSVVVAIDKVIVFVFFFISSFFFYCSLRYNRCSVWGLNQFQVFTPLRSKVISLFKRNEIQLEQLIGFCSEAKN